MRHARKGAAKVAAKTVAVAHTKHPRDIDVFWQPMPEGIRTMLEPYVTKHLHVAPVWCRKLTIGYATSSDAVRTLAEITTDCEYRQASVVFYSLMLMEPEIERERTVLHELLHIAVAPLSDWTHSMISDLVEDGAMKSHLLKEATQRMEGTVQDLMYSLLPSK